MNAIVALVLGLGLVVPVKADSADPRVKQVVAKFYDLAVVDQMDFLKAIAANGDVAGLTAIAKSEGTFAGCAAREAVRILPAKNVIAYIKQFPLGSEPWKYAMQGTDKHPKEAVISYIKALMKGSKDPVVRCACYSVCGVRGWDDLAPMAREDLNDKRPVTLANISAEGAVSLGKTAQRYLDSLQKKPPTRP